MLDFAQLLFSLCTVAFCSTSALVQAPHFLVTNDQNLGGGEGISRFSMKHETSVTFAPSAIYFFVSDFLSTNRESRRAFPESF